MQEYFSVKAVIHVFCMESKRSNSVLNNKMLSVKQLTQESFLRSSSNGFTLSTIFDPLLYDHIYANNENENENESENENENENEET